MSLSAPRRQLDDPLGAERFEREAATLARLDSMHIVPIYDYGIEGGRPFLVTKFVAGGDLESRLREQGSLSAQDAVAIVKQVCDALGDAHELAFCTATSSPPMCSRRSAARSDDVFVRLRHRA